MNGKAIIPLSALVVGSTITFAELKQHGEMPSTRQWLGLAAVYTTLSLGSDLGFKPANGFAGLLMVAVFLGRGQQAFGYLNTKAGPPRKGKALKQQQQPRAEEPRVVERRLS